MASSKEHFESAEKWLRIMNQNDQMVAVIEAAAAAARAELAAARYIEAWGPIEQGENK